MPPEQRPAFLAEVTAHLAVLPGIVAVTLGGSRARGEPRPDSDWDVGLYYRGGFSTQPLRALGYSGHIAEPGDWGRFMNGGAWLTIEDERVDLLLRDLDVVEHWQRHAEAGEFEVDLLEGYLVGFPSYVLVGEMALGRLLSGHLPPAAFPPRLRVTAPPRWRFTAGFSLSYAQTYARRGELTNCLGMLAKSGLAEAHARVAEHGVWALNEKGLPQRAGLAVLDELLAEPQPLVELTRAVARLLELPPP